MPTEPPAPELPRNFLRPCVLLLLREEPAHGYDLLQRLAPLGWSGEDPGRLYRTLRGLEKDGCVASEWEASATGPDRRVYRLTRVGMEELHAHARGLEESRRLLDRFLSRYGEFVALRADAAAIADR